MSNISSSFLREFTDKGFFNQVTNLQDLDETLNKEKVTAYIGFDCTAPSLHVGNLMMIMSLRLLQKHGHKPIVLVGGATTRIGDPSGRDEARKMLTDEQIEKNKLGIKTVLEKFIKFGDGPTDAILVDNAEWLDKLGYIEFLREYGRYFSVNKMLSMESVKNRLSREQNLSFLEFNYSLFQAYDFTALNKKYNCRLQLGGSDQWGNIVSGVDLGRRLNLPELFGLTSPLITTASGTKMGKSLGGAVWLSENMLSPYEYWQFWRNTDDRDVVRFLRFFTDLSEEEIIELAKLRDNKINEAKKILANEATKLCHGEEESRKAARTAHETFEKQESAEGLPVAFIEKEELEEGILAYDLFRRAELTSSGTEAKRLIRGGGARINNEVITNEFEKITLNTFVGENQIKLSAGRKNHIIVKISNN